MKSKTGTTWRRFRLRLRHFPSRQRLAIKGWCLRLTEEQALSRLCVVSLIEFFGVLLTIMLITLVAWGFGVGDLRHWQGWQKECGLIAGILFSIAVVILLTTVALVLVMLHGGTWLRYCRPIVAEGAILVAFIVNIVAFCVAISRSGGPSHSFFTQLVPMQLSGILILEQQKATMTNRKSGARRRSCYYAAFAILVWLVSAPFSVGLIQMGGGNYEDFVASFLFVLGVIVSVAAFIIPPRLAARLHAKRRIRKASVMLPQPS